MVEIIKMLAQQYADIRWAVEAGAITKEQYKEFTGKEYSERQFPMFNFWKETLVLAGTLLVILMVYVVGLIYLY